jgi:hypothetical protein
MEKKSVVDWSSTPTHRLLLGSDGMAVNGGFRLIGRKQILRCIMALWLFLGVSNTIRVDGEYSFSLRKALKKKVNILHKKRTVRNT